MEGKKDSQKEFSTCMEGSAFAEMMKKMMDKQGGCTTCEEMMKSMMTKCCGIKEEPGETKKEGSHDSGK